MKGETESITEEETPYPPYTRRILAVYSPYAQIVKA